MRPSQPSSSNLSRIASEITVAITVFDRRDFILEAIESALNQPFPIPVIVVEDHSPDEGLRDYVLNRFGGRISYIRNPRRRGLFDNWNVCLEVCQTEYLSILHDDDYLLPNFLETMTHLVESAPDRGIYFGGVIEERADSPLPVTAASQYPVQWAEMNLNEFARHSLFGFPGNLFSVNCLRELGGFQAGAWFAGDWHAWFRLAVAHGGAFTKQSVVVGRPIEDQRRGSTRVERTGRNHAATVVQRKRCFARLKQLGMSTRVTFREMRAMENPRIKLILKHGATFAPRMLFYNIRLLRFSRPQSLKSLTRFLCGWLFTPRVIKWISNRWLGNPAHDTVKYSLRGS